MSRPPGRRRSSAPVATASFTIEQAYTEHGGALYGYAVNALGERGSAEDLVQEVFARAWRSADRFDPQLASLRTWLFAIARNLVRDAHRARTRRPRMAEPPGQALAEPATASSIAPIGRVSTPQPVEDQVAARLALVEALARLSPEQREVVAGVHLTGQTYADIAATTGVEVATLRTRMYYGLRAMRAVLTEAGWTEDE